MTNETAVEHEPPWSWGEDVVLVVLLALVGALGMATGVAADSQVQTSIGLVMLGFAGKVLADLRAQSQRGQNE